MTERTTEEWGRLAVSLPGWRWMPGMLPQVFECNEWIENPRFDSYTEESMWMYNKSVPDPDDPATAGCLLALLGDDAWRVRAAHAQNRRHPWQVDHGDRISWHETLGPACIAAAEALGRWPGGAS